MGVYDILFDDLKQVQVKCFNNEMKGYEIGDKVPVDGSYVIMFPLREDARFALIGDGLFLGFTDVPPETPNRIIDKWGKQLNSYEDFSDPFDVPTKRKEEA